MNEPDACIELLDKWMIGYKEKIHKKFVLNSKGTEEGDEIFLSELKKLNSKLHSYIEGTNKDISEYDLPEALSKCLIEVVGASIVFQERIVLWCLIYPAIMNISHFKENILKNKSKE
jgi:hypothetical protein